MNIETVTTWVVEYCGARPDSTIVAAYWVWAIGLIVGAVVISTSPQQPKTEAQLLRQFGRITLWPIYGPIYLATWPIRKAWRWLKRRKAEAQRRGQEAKERGHNEACETVRRLWREGRKENAEQYACLGVAYPYSVNLLDELRKEDRDVERDDAMYAREREMARECIKPIAPQTPYGSKPSGEPEWRRAMDELENTILPTLASHHERLAALEGAKPAPVAEWRVFRDGPYITLRGRDGVEALSLNGRWAWVVKGLEGCASDQVELHGPEKDGIVASYLAWRGK